MKPNTLESSSKKNDDSGGISEKTEHAILSKLLFDEGEFLGRLEETIDRAMRFFRIEPRTGRIVLSDDAKRRKTQDQIRLLLAGRYFAWKLNLVGTDKMNYREIGVELNRPTGGISPVLTDLVRDGDLVRNEEGLVSMPFHRIDGTLRELEQSASTEIESEAPATRGNGSRRTTRQRRSDPVVQSMLERPLDLSEYVWIKNLKKALDLGLAGLLIAKEKYDVSDMSCGQIETFLTRVFPVKVTKAALSMALMKVKGEYIAAAVKGNEISYTLLPYGKEYLMKAVEEARRSAETDASATSE